MPSQPEETPEQDLRHIVQYVVLARTPRLAESERAEYLTEIEHRARAAIGKLTGPRVPLAYLTETGPAKMLRFYWCLGCGVNHWEDERATYDDHILYAGQIEYGHRTVELVR